MIFVGFPQKKKEMIKAILSGIFASLASLFSKFATNKSPIWVVGIVLSNLAMWFTFTSALEQSSNTIRYQMNNFII